MLYFATFFDSNYLSRGIVLLNSIKAHCSSDFTLFILSLDNGVEAYFRQHGNKHVEILTLRDIENFFPELKEIKIRRSRVEYYFTLSPYLPLYILRNFAQVDRITSLDTDILFFDDPNIIFQRYPQASVLITPHDFSSAIKDLARYGLYNVSFQSFKKDRNGMACLEKWRDDCLGWCSDYLDEANNRFADQKYLDTWQQEFDHVEVIDIAGAGAAPWNIDNHSYELVSGKIFVDHNPLIYFHYQHLRVLNKFVALSGFGLYKVRQRSRAVKSIYRTYISALKKIDIGRSNSDQTITRNRASGSILKNMLFSRKGHWIFNRFWMVHFNPLEAWAKLKEQISVTWRH